MAVIEEHKPDLQGGTQANALPENNAVSHAAGQEQPQASKPAFDPEVLKKRTTGEKAYEVVQFIFGKVFIVAVTAVLAFGGHQKYAPDKFGPIPNFLKKFQKWAHETLLHNKVFPMGNKGPLVERIAGIFTSTLLLSHGGNAFAPFIHWLENGKESISQFFNKLIGKPGEIEIAHERLKDEPKQTWGDTIKGRFFAWASGLGAATVVDTIINKTVGKHKSGQYYLDAYEDWFGRKLTGLTKAGKEIGATPIIKELNEVQKANKMYRFGKVIALDLYITSATLILWSAISRGSAKKRHAKPKEEHAAVNAHLAEKSPGPQPQEAAAPAASHEERHFTDTIKPRASGLEKTREATTLPLAHAAKIAAQREASESQAAAASALS